MSCGGTPPSPPGGGHYALFEAIRHGRHRQALLLAEAGLGLDGRDEAGRTPLAFAVAAAAQARDRLRLVRLFLAAGADPNTADREGLTPLMRASGLGQAETVRALLQCVWTDPCLTDCNGNTALMHAAASGHHEVIAVFISGFRDNIRRLQLHSRNHEGLTALHLAVRSGSDLCARLLTREAQFFPTGIEEFPDPKDLDREPTPVHHQESLYFAKRDSSLFKFPSAQPPSQLARCKSREKKSVGTMTLEQPSGSETPTAYRLKELECSMVDDLVAMAVPYPYQSHHTKSTQVTSVPRQMANKVASKSANQFEELLPNAAQQSMDIVQPKGSLNLEPLAPIENTDPHKGYQRRCLLKQSCSRLQAGMRNHMHEMKAAQYSRGSYSSDDDSVISGASIRTLQKVKSVSSLLPAISCSKEAMVAPLPPVRYSTMRRCTKKDPLCFPSATAVISVRTDQGPREMELFKKNVLTLS